MCLQHDSGFFVSPVEKFSIDVTYFKAYNMKDRSKDIFLFGCI